MLNLLVNNFNNIREMEDFIKSRILHQSFPSVKTGDGSIGHTLEYKLFGKILGTGITDYKDIEIKAINPDKGLNLHISNTFRWGA